MEKKIIEEHILKVVQTQQVGVKETTVYVAMDGKEFSNKTECKHYEERLQDVKNGESQFQKVTFGDDDIVALVIFSFDYACHISSAKFFTWTVTKDKEKLELAVKYLRAMRCDNCYWNNITEGFEEGDKVLICSWTEDANSDYPSDVTRTIRCDEAIKVIEDLSSKIKIALK